MKKSLLAVVVVSVAMLVPSVAFADSTCGGYSQKTCTTTTTSNTTTSPAPTTHATTPAPTTTSPSTGAVTDSTGPAEATTATSSGTLPFTGIDVAALMVGASILLGGGLVIRYLSRDQQS